ncbi:MAG: MMPL family transporter [Clostridium sp.]|jgi:predicted RND superfamily exporter protein|nr:MMPL family transporter [Clostridium sp.]
MKKLANFVVDKRYFVLAVMLLLTAVCAVLIPQVEVVTDTTEYLPDDSSMRAGLDQMDAEFPQAETAQTIRVMFGGLDVGQAADVQALLATLPYVDGVEYDADSADYRKDGYTLFVLNTAYAYDSAEEKSIEASVKDIFSAYDVTVANDSTGVLEIPLWVIAIALAILLVIMLAMCGSWVEPFLFLAAIGCAIVINMGTNLMQGRVSSTTFSIAAILQLVLSMDYSIMLMNRYRQEAQLAGSRLDAMKTALRNAFLSISSSAATTMVGLLMLVFMSFKIGADVGIVLAKGVAISLLCIFTILPGLILLFDKAIRKTAKPVPHIPLGGLAKFSFRGRHILACAFVVTLVGTFFLQRATELTYSLTAEDPIADVFPKKNTILMLYRNADEERVAEIAEQLEKDPHVKSSSGYASTLGRPYTAEELTDVLEDMGSDLALDPAMLRILYYDYYTHGKIDPVEAGEFLRFVADEVAADETFAGQIPDDLKEHSDSLSKFSDAAALTRPMSAAELAGFFGMEPDQAEKLLLYYYTQNGGVDTGTMTLPQFSDFVVKDVAASPEYAGMLDAGALARLGRLADFTDAEKMTARESYTSLARILGMEEEQMRLLFVYCYASSDRYTPEPMAVPEFLDFLLHDVAGNPMFAGWLDAALLGQIQAMLPYTDAALLQKQMTGAELAAFLGEDADQVSQIYLMRSAGDPSATMSPMEYIDYTLTALVPNPAFSAQFTEEKIARLAFLQSLMQASTSGAALDHAQMAQMFGMESAAAKMIYTLRDSGTKLDSWRLSVQTVVNFLVGNREAFGSLLAADRLAELKTAQKLINGSVEGTEYSADDLSSLVGMDAEQTEQLYLLYRSEHGDTGGWVLSVGAFVDFIIDAVLTDKDLAEQFDAVSADELILAQTVIDAVVSGKTYTPDELADLIDGLSGDLSEDTLRLLFLYYASVKSGDPSWTLSIRTLFDYLTDVMMEDPRFEKMIDADLRAEITEMESELDAAVLQLKGADYSRWILETDLPDESDETSEFLSSLERMCEEKLTGDYYLIGSSPMNYEMSKTFRNEMLFITVLTALAIFVVVAVAFRSLAVSMILVLIVQCGVFLTISVSGLLGYSMYYLSCLIVQGILMGATIDYGILFTNYYREKRRTMEVQEALTAAYDGSIHTIMTSGSIMVFALGVLGTLPCDPAIGTICQTLSAGTLSATLLILFVLPGMLATFDKWAAGRRPAP